MQRISRWRVFYDFLGSMNLAVTLLVMLAIASVIGTVVKQGEAFPDYVIKFGPFWAEVFDKLGIFNIYSTAWFVIVILFLILSTSVCVVRHVPVFVREMRSWAERLSAHALQHQPNHDTLQCTQTPRAKTVIAMLHQQGFRTRTHDRDDGTLITARKGQWNRLGYFLTHVGIIVILAGAVVDSNLMLKYRVLTGEAEPETRNVNLNEVNPRAILPPDNISFRGSVTIPEGKKADFIFLPYDRGYFVQKLPFTLAVKDFRIDYYDTGMPKSFNTDLVLIDKQTGEKIEKTISVNHPLIYGNIAIYQSSFSDGGSLLKVKVWPLFAHTMKPVELDTAVNRTEVLETSRGRWRLEFDDFKLFNIVPAEPEEQKKTGKKTHNNGPKIVYKVRNDQGIAWEYETYMQPNRQQGRWFFISGVRKSVAEPYRYLFIPADDKRSLKRFFDFLQLLNNDKARLKLLAGFVRNNPAFKDLSIREQAMQIQLWQNLLQLFRTAGFRGIDDFIAKNVPEKERKQAREFYLGQLSSALQTLYVEMLKAQGRIQSRKDLTDFDKQWFEDAIVAINSLPAYGPQLFLQLESFRQIQASGIQVTKSPGKDIVYFGSLMLTLGVFLMFYLRYQRVWVLIQPDDRRVIIAARDGKNTPEMARTFSRLRDQLKSLCEREGQPEQAG
ncbi:cytochrome c biogenesis protein ResB [Sulfurivirga sp.]|uniref:cytochrome c biogenesis protein ResB n=1 Tax=Sulfurivirga sp. TaxID=2614236 RepID=UPI0025ED662E|nr:cytochrome c biogenesis protein ResB [Sulfurivirga sp.]